MANPVELQRNVDKAVLRLRHQLREHFPNEASVASGNTLK
jgi:hypothetical protein